MRCVQCGFEAVMGAAFCSRCGYRLFEPRPAMKHEFAVTRLRPSWWRYKGALTLAVLLVLAAIAAPAMHPPQSQASPVLIIISAAIFGLVYLRRVYLRWNLTSERLVEQRGLLATHRREMELADIRSVEVSRTLWQKMTGIGSIRIASAASAEFAIGLDDIAEPDRVAETIRQARLKRLH